MRAIRFLITFSITVILVVLLSVKIGKMPPLGKFLNPFNGFWQNAESISYVPQQKITLPELKGEVKVVFDQHLIPHIFAQNNHDLYMVQGYITAQHRLWQMEFQTKAAAGRISEIIGEKALSFDRLQRRKGLLFAAKNSLKEMLSNPESQLALEAYTQGVNGYISSITSKDFPIEYKLLDFKPELWTPLKSVLLLKLMANDLSFREKDMQNTNTLNLIGIEDFDLLFPDVPNDLEPVIPNEKVWNFEPEKIQQEEIVIPVAQKPNALLLKEQEDEFIKGSNNWAIAGSRTKSGSPILANDPHLALRLPSIWYLVQLNSPSTNVFGTSLPGAASVIVGFNDSISWGVTNAKRDVKDWFKITFKSNDKKDYYLLDNEWLKTKKVIEEIKIRNQQTFYDTVIYTHYGPVVHDNIFSNQNFPKNYALRWTAHDPSNEIMTFLKLNQANDYKDYVKALSFYNCPAQNFAFASKNGDIALWVQGKFVNKWPDQGKFLMDGKESSQQWQSFIPQLHNAHILNPTRGFVSSANQYPVPPDYPYYVYDYKYENYRNKRINHLLDSNDNFTVKQVMKMQNDNFNQKAFEFLPFLLSKVKSKELNDTENQYLKELKNWNYYDNIELFAPAIFETWRKNLYDLIWDEFKSDTLDFSLPSWHTTTYLMKNNPKLKYFNIENTPATEDLNDLINESFRSSVQELEQQKSKGVLNWGNYKATTIEHLAQIKAFSRTDISVGGNRNDINANFGKHGVSMRIIVELSDITNAWGIYPGGQSGNPGSPYYDNFIDFWKEGEYIKFELYDNVNIPEDSIKYYQILTPNKP